MKAKEMAQYNFENHLSKNPYPGRGLVIGRSGEDSWLILYWIMGRSANSRNRKFVADGETLRTEPVDPALVKDPSLIIYEAMLDLPGIYLVSNGDQTRTMYEALKDNRSTGDALAEREREPDAPNFTPRISGMLDFKDSAVKIELSILKANPLDTAYTDRFFYRPAIPRPGFGFGLTTYTGDGDPLPSFTGEPLLLPCNGSAEEVLESYWSALNTENRISMAAKEISERGARANLLVRNRF